MKENILLLFFIALFFMSITSADSGPTGANVSLINSTRAVSDSSPGNYSAIAGNITELNIFGETITSAWQGYFGNVSGTIHLADAQDRVMYNWSLASPQGEIYASNSSTITWANIDCFNWTANGTSLESSFNISATDADGVNETFSYSNNHELFYTGSTQFSQGTCMTAFIFDNTDVAVDNNFEEVLMTDGSNTVYASLLEQDQNGFDSRTHDFEMLVLEDGHGTNVATTTYFFWVELGA